MWNTAESAEAIRRKIDDLYHKVTELPYNNTSAILRITAEVEKIAAQHRDNTELLILQTRLQIMNSQEQRARALANRVWEIGGNISLMFEKMYLDDLINLGMIDMATVLIRPRFENLQEGLRFFPLEMLRYALITGKSDLIRRMTAEAEPNRLFKALNQFAETYQKTKYTSHFSNIARIVLDNVGGLMCGYDFNFYTDRGFTDVEIILYFNNYDFNINKYVQLINSKIDGYCLTSGVKRINNLSFACRHIKDRS
uniref:Uncharacterized protein n=1 Tax=uncultured Alphaproteobacteria bacterium TaxID=91750 RepID=A0A6G8F338_9PROT|nr:hypothetical protein PlAlph_4940 [uncultured Alphaproteobacteria bacterium]